MGRHRRLPVLRKLPGALHPPTSSFKTRKLRLRCHQSREKPLHHSPERTHSPGNSPPTLLQLLKSPACPPRGRQQTRGAPSLLRGEPAHEWPRTCRRSSGRAGSSARGLPSRPLAGSADHTRTVRPPPPPPRGTEVRREAGPRAAEGWAGTSAALTLAWSRPPVGTAVGSLVHSGSAVCRACVESPSVPRWQRDSSIAVTFAVFFCLFWG